MIHVHKCLKFCNGSALLLWCQRCRHCYNDSLWYSKWRQTPVDDKSRFSLSLVPQCTHKQSALYSAVDYVIMQAPGLCGVIYETWPRDTHRPLYGLYLIGGVSRYKTCFKNWACSGSVKKVWHLHFYTKFQDTNEIRNICFHISIHWKLRVMMPTLSSLVASEVVVMTTSNLVREFRHKYRQKLRATNIIFSVPILAETNPLTSHLHAITTWDLFPTMWAARPRTNDNIDGVLNEHL